MNAEAPDPNHPTPSEQDSSEQEAKTPRKSLRPLVGADRTIRRRMGLRDEFLLALFPTLTILIVLSLVEALSGQRLLFASLAASAFLIYLDPQHGTNRIRTLFGAHLGAATVGVVMDLILGSGYPAAGAAMVVSIILMITLDIVHPPAISTALGFAFRSGESENLVLFLLAVLIVAILVFLQRAVLHLLAYLTAGHESD